MRFVRAEKVRNVRFADTVSEAGVAEPCSGEALADYANWVTALALALVLWLSRAVPVEGRSPWSVAATHALGAWLHCVTSGNQ